MANVAPTVTAPADQTANEGASTSFGLGSFSDPGANDAPWAVDVSWGDSTTDTAFNRATQGAAETMAEKKAITTQSSATRWKDTKR